MSELAPASRRGGVGTPPRMSRGLESRKGKHTFIL